MFRTLLLTAVLSSHLIFFSISSLLLSISLMLPVFVFCFSKSFFLSSIFITPSSYLTSFLFLCHSLLILYIYLFTLLFFLALYFSNSSWTHFSNHSERLHLWFVNILVALVGTNWRYHKSVVIHKLTEHQPLDVFLTHETYHDTTPNKYCKLLVNGELFLQKPACRNKLL